MRSNNDFFLVPDTDPPHVDAALASVKAAFLRRRRQRGAALAASAATVMGVGVVALASGNEPSSPDVAAGGAENSASEQLDETSTTAPPTTTEATADSAEGDPSGGLLVAPATVRSGEPAVVTVRLPADSPYEGFGLEIRLEPTSPDGVPLWAALCPSDVTCEPSSLSESRPTSIPYRLLVFNPLTGEHPGGVFSTGGLPAGTYELVVASPEGEPIVGTLEVAP